MTALARPGRPGTPEGRSAERILLFTLAFVHRLAILAWTTSLSADSAYYLWTAESLAQGDLKRALSSFEVFHPLYSLLVAVFGTLGGSFAAAGYAIPILVSSLAVVPLYDWLRGTWNARIAWWTGLIYAFHPPLSLESSEAMLTGLFLGLFLMALGTFVGALRNGSYRQFCLSGLFSALTYLTRPEGLALGLFFLVAIVWASLPESATGRAGEGPRDPGISRARIVAGAFTALAISVAVSAPYLLWLRQKQGLWVLTPRPSVTRLLEQVTKLSDTGPASSAGKPVLPPYPAPASRPNPPPPVQRTPSPSLPQSGTSRDGNAPPAAPDVIPEAEHPPPPAKLDPASTPPSPSARNPFLATTAKKILQAVYWPLLPFFLLGLLQARSLGASLPLRISLGGMTAVFWFPPLLAFWLDPDSRPSHRYLLPGVVAILPFVAAGMTAVWDRIAIPANGAEILIRRRAMPGIFLCAIAAILLFKTLRPRRAEEISYRAAGDWLRRHRTVPPSFVISGSEKIAYYGGFYLSYLPKAYDEKRWSFRGDPADGSWTIDAGGSDPRSVSDAVRLTRESYRTLGVMFLILDESSLRILPPDYPAGLETVGFECVARWEPTPRTKGVWIYRLAPPPSFPDPEGPRR